MRRAGILEACAALLLLPMSGTTGLAQTTRVDPSETLRAIAETALRPEGAVEVSSLRVELGLGELVIEAGLFVPASPVAGGVHELAFVGSATLEIEPSDDIEADQLELFTGQSSLSAPIDHAVLVFADADASAALLEGRARASENDPRRSTVAEVFDRWVRGPVRRGIGADMAVFGAALADPVYRGYVAAWMKSETLGEFHHVMNPTEAEPVEVGQFVAADLGDFERQRVERYIDRQRRRRGGRFEQVNVDDIGTWDTWVSTIPAGHSSEAAAGIEARHFEIDATLEDSPPALRARARVDLTCAAPGRRVVALDLYPDLEVTSVRDAGGNVLFHHRAGYQVYVVLADPVSEGERFSLTLEYRGSAMRKLESGVLVLEDTLGWYPGPAGISRATYDVTLRWPKRLEVLSSGVAVERGEEGKQVWERRRLEVPALGFSFEMGDFDVLTRQLGDVELVVGFSTAHGSRDRKALDATMETLADALDFFQQTFGPYPAERLTVATVPRGFSQGNLGFITLSHHLLWTPSGYVSTLSPENKARYRAETIAHELSHQWWGNLVGWHSYRDQWLSEALANYSAMLYMKERADSPAIYLARQAKEWKNALLKRTRDGRLYESLGPVVLGRRLSSSKARRGYSAIAYQKGSLVFRMLARGLGEDRLNEMLAALVGGVDNRTIDTPTFIRALEHMSGIDLSGFADRFIYGTGTPEIYYQYSIRAFETNRWRVEGVATQVAEGTFSYKLIRLENGGWDVVRRKIPAMDVQKSWLVVPFQITLEDEQPDVRKKDRGVMKTGRGLGGRLLLDGATTPFSIEIDHRPRDFFLDQGGEVLATFFCESREPKRVLRYRAYELAAEGRFEEAEPLFRQALDAPLYSESVRELHDKVDIERSRRFQDALIWFDLARLHLDRGEDDLAREALVAGRKSLSGPNRDAFETRQFLLESRLDLRSGDAKAAWSRLSRHVRLRFRHDYDESIGDTLRRKKFQTGKTVSGGGYALLAAATYEVGKHAIAIRAAEEARHRGADVEALESLLPPADGDQLASATD